MISTSPLVFDSDRRGGTRGPVETRRPSTGQAKPPCARRRRRRIHGPRIYGILGRGHRSRWVRPAPSFLRVARDTEATAVLCAIVYARDASEVQLKADEVLPPLAVLLAKANATIGAALEPAAPHLGTGTSVEVSQLNLVSSYRIGIKRCFIYGNDWKGDSRLMITTAKPPQTRDLYKLFNDRGMLWAPAKWILLKAIPHRHKIFLWLAFRGRLNTKSNMVTKKWCSDGGCDQCPALETFEHIALHCRQADWVWDKLQIADTARKASELSALCDIQEQDAKTWPICIAACLPVLWQARNDRVFNQRQPNRATLLHNIAQCLSLWAHRSDKQKPKLIAWADLFENP